MRILVYGAGAVGLGLGSCLLKAGADVDFITRKDTARALRRYGLTRNGLFGHYHASPGKFVCRDSIIKLPKQSYDFILVSTKSFDSLVAAKDLAKRPSFFHKKTRIVLCQNGWGNAEVFAKHFTKSRIYSARIITGFTRPQPHQVKITVHADAIQLGSLFKQPTTDLAILSEAISKGGIPCQLSANIGKDLWAKMLYNCALNSVGALLGVPYGILGELPSSRQIMEEIFAEIFAVMRRAGFRTHWGSPQAYAKFFYARSLPLTAQHRSSTLQDLKAGKRTEIDSLNGVIVALGKRHGIPTPVNQTIYQLVKFIEARTQQGRVV
jgi:2-dehydropantoate 2-reductase